jgi:ribonuclease Y
MDFGTILLILLALAIGGAGGFYGYKKTLTQKALQFKERMTKAKDLEEEILEQAKKKAEQILAQAEERGQKAEDQRIQKMEVIQNRLLAREEKMDEKLEKLEQEKQKFNEKQKELDDAIKQQVEKLAELAGLSKEAARQLLLDQIQKEYEGDFSKYLEKLKNIKKEEADKEAAMIISKSLPRVAVDAVTEFTTKTVDLPNEDFKGKLIGREGRNISFLEKTTGVEMIVDDTPLVVRLSSFDSEKRYIAATTLQRLVKDGRINPFYIEKTYNEVVSEMDGLYNDKGKEALTMLNLPMMKPEIVKMI